MQNIFRIGLAAIGLVPVGALRADSVQMSPGRWEVTTSTESVIVDGQPLSQDLIKDETGADCISVDSAREPARYFLKPDDEKACKPRGTVGAGRIAMTGQCTSKSFGEMMVTGAGTYGSDSFEISFTATSAVGGKPLLMKFVMRGHYAGACRGDEDK
jgi:hypothetical protein